MLRYLLCVEEEEEIKKNETKLDNLSHMYQKFHKSLIFADFFRAVLNILSLTIFD